VQAAANRQLHEVMVPRTEVDFLDASMPVYKALRLSSTNPHSAIRGAALTTRLSASCTYVTSSHPSTPGRRPGSARSPERQVDARH
jgi:hypothetical protein